MGGLGGGGRVGRLGETQHPPPMAGPKSSLVPTRRPHLDTGRLGRSPIPRKNKLGGYNYESSRDLDLNASGLRPQASADFQLKPFCTPSHHFPMLHPTWRKDLLPPKTKLEPVEKWLLYILRKKKLRVVNVAQRAYSFLGGDFVHRAPKQACFGKS